MDIFRLDPVTFLPMDIVEGYNSMIWTERYIGAGEFEFKTSRVFESLPLLPRGGFISLRDTEEVMIIETTSIGEDSDGYPELTVKGRTFETFLENRALEPTVHGVAWPTFKPYSVSEITSLLLWNHLVNASGEDPTREEWYIDRYTSLPNVLVTETINVPQEAQTWWFEAGPVYQVFKDFLALGVVGVRTIRPSKSSGTVVSFDISRSPTRGDIIKTPTSDIAQLRIDIFDGFDRTMYQTDRDPVIFHYDSGHVDRPKYLFSIQEYKNIALVISSLWTRLIIPPTVPSDISGFDRRILFVDAGVLDVNDPNSEYVLYQKAVTELQKHNLVRLFDGEISPVSPYVYGRDYFLGDKVSLIARYGFEETMIVSEYIRTEDKEGDRGYPGLSSLRV